MTNIRPAAAVVDTDALGSSATSEAHRKILVAQRSAATWTMACHALDRADFADLCEALDLPADRVSLDGVRKVHGKRQRKGGRR